MKREMCAESFGGRCWSVAGTTFKIGQREFELWGQRFRFQVHNGISNDARRGEKCASAGKSHGNCSMNCCSNCDVSVISTWLA